MKTFGLAVFNAVVWIMESPKCWDLFRRFLWICVIYITLKTIL